MSGNGVSSFQRSGMSSTEMAALWIEGDMERYLELLRRDCGAVL